MGTENELPVSCCNASPIVYNPANRSPGSHPKWLGVCEWGHHTSGGITKVGSHIPCHRTPRRDDSRNCCSHILPRSHPGCQCQHRLPPHLLEPSHLPEPSHPSALTKRGAVLEGTSADLNRARLRHGNGLQRRAALEGVLLDVSDGFGQPGSGNWSQDRISSTDQHTQRTGVERGASHGTCVAVQNQRRGRSRVGMMSMFPYLMCGTPVHPMNANVPI